MRHAARATMGAELRPMLKSMDWPSDPKVADPGSALDGNAGCDRAAVSRGRSSQTPTVMGGTG